MEVYFDWELDDSLEQPIHKWVYDDVRAFIKERFKPLDDEVERRKTGEIPFAGFIWGDTTIQIRYFFIPDDLVEKLNKSLSQDDLDYIMDKISQKIDSKAKEN